MIFYLNSLTQMLLQAALSDKGTAQINAAPRSPQADAFVRSLRLAAIQAGSNPESANLAEAAISVIG